MACGRVRGLCEKLLGPSVAIDVDQSWVRGQHAPGVAPPLRRPHSWHLEGALGFDFASSDGTEVGGGLLPVVTCCIALSSCGVDAPGLELMTSIELRCFRADEIPDRIATDEFVVVSARSRNATATPLCIR